MYCSNCGSNNKDGVKFCNSCGSPIDRGEGLKRYDTDAYVSRPRFGNKKIFILGGIILALLLLMTVFFLNKNANSPEDTIQTLVMGVKNADVAACISCLTPSLVEKIETMMTYSGFTKEKAMMDIKKSLEYSASGDGKVDFNVSIVNEEIKGNQADVEVSIKMIHNGEVKDISEYGVFNPTVIMEKIEGKWYVSDLKSGTPGMERSAFSWY